MNINQNIDPDTFIQQSGGEKLNLTSLEVDKRNVLDLMQHPGWTTMISYLDKEFKRDLAGHLAKSNISDQEQHWSRGSLHSAAKLSSAPARVIGLLDNLIQLAGANSNKTTTEEGAE